MDRVNLLVPADVVPRLAIPEAARTSGVALRGGDLFLPAVPAGEARTWVDNNPGVREVTRRPAVRRFRPHTYQLAAVLFLIAAVQPLIVAGAGDLEEPLPWWLAAAALAGAGITAGYKSIPFDHVRFD